MSPVEVRDQNVRDAVDADLVELIEDRPAPEVDADTLPPTPDHPDVAGVPDPPDLVGSWHRRESNPVGALCGNDCIARRGRARFPAAWAKSSVITSRTSSSAAFGRSTASI